ncbi:MAG: NHLP family bacteriocin export ABC transporter peptidase/permease/ATPase subunit [Candidatus Muirbacterium halophilum]|nr:NHLP family bacteriocin export ABC transporter peptidase/permease/ATPase subunit [Candidatus Muirbacterium halophilum]MCK9476498.1 NHLP family bacteriocin export ABC transporter peptidase/permease/ATPase subunit [Candidatus Muirbacterium halophilum]
MSEELENKTKKPIEYKRKKVPTILQMEAVECGAASLAMIMACFGLYKPLEELRVSCGVSRDGSKASNLLKAARNYGFIAKGLRKEPEDLKYLKPPMIIHWNFNHFLVLEGFKKDKVYLNDPASGPRIVSFEEFDCCYTGIAIVFEKGPDFKKGGTKKTIINLLSSRFKGLEQAFSYISLAGLFLVIPGLVIPVFTKIFIDNVLIGMMNDWFKPLIFGMAITAIIRFILTMLQQHYLLRLETKLALKTSAQFFWHVLRLPIDFFNQRYAGEIAGRVESNDTIANLIAEKLTANFINLFTIVFYVVIMFQYDVFLTFIGVLVAIINFLFLHLISKHRKEQSQKILIEEGKLMGASMAGLSAIETIKAGGTESDFFAKWSGYQASYLNSAQKMGFSNQILSQVPMFLSALNSALILSIGGIKVMNGVMSVGMLVAFQSLMQSFIQPVEKIVELGGELQQITGDMTRLDDVLNYAVDPLTISENKEEISKVKLEGFVKLENISFGYNVLEKPFIENFNLDLSPGKRVALVGGSGSGKSTIAKIISGLNHSWNGKIYFDNKERNNCSKRAITNSLAVVDQDICMFEGTIRDNLTLWDSTISDSDIIIALKDAEIFDIVASRPGGLDSIIVEGGTNFSGGQRQRLEIARALVNNPSILVLDEATSALDPKTEKIIDSNIRRRGCTCIIVAHRLSTIRDADEIIVLKNGNILERGNHEELIEQNGYYFNLINMN